MPSHPELTDAYSAIIIRRDATEILLLPKDADWTLPRVEIQQHQRVAEQLTKEIRKASGLATCLLLVPSWPSLKAASAVLKCAQQNQKAPQGTSWMPVDAALDCCSAEEAATIVDDLAELAAYAAGEKPGPFAKPG